MFDALSRDRRAVPVGVMFSFALLIAFASMAAGETPEPPPRSDTITAVSQFLACSGNPYALCYYSGPTDAPSDTNLPVPALPCELGPAGDFANCKCYAIDDPDSVNYVALPSILNPTIRNHTETVCGSDGSGCLNMKNETICAKDPDAKFCRTAPVCRHLGTINPESKQTFYPKGGLISTFSFKNSKRYPISSTDCSETPYLKYAGCMTAGCGQPYEEKGQNFVDCSCPTFTGPFQFGQTGSDLACNLGGANVWSAANTTISLPSLPDRSTATE